jgi:hypothetical protein
LHNGLINDMRMSVASAEALATVYDQALDELHRRYADRSQAV